MKNKSNFKKCLPLIIIFIFATIINPFLLNDFSFKFLRTVRYWVSITPLIVLLPLFVIVVIYENKNLVKK